MFSLESLDLPPITLAVIAFMFGAVIGSFLNVVIYRLHTGRSLSGRSHCLSCAVPLRWFDLIPIVSYLVLRGRCGRCGSHFTPRYVAVELLVASLFVLVAVTFSDLIEVVLLATVVSLLTVVLVYDLRHFIIPDEYTLAVFVAAVVRAVYLVVVGHGAWLGLVYDVAAALAAGFFLWVLWFVSKGRWIGFGDVKLVVPLGLLVGATSVFSMVVLSFWVGAGVSLLLLGLATLIRRGKVPLPFMGGALTMKSAVPFAPFLIAGCFLVLFFQIDVLSLFYNDVF